MKKIRKYFEDLNLSYKKEITLFLIVNLLFIGTGIAALILLNSTITLIICLIIGLIVNVSLVMRYSFIRENILKSHEDEFVYFIQYLEIFLSNDYNIYFSLVAVKEFTSLWMQEKIVQLINDIDNDKTITPFITFSKNFKAPIVSNVMINIYQMVNQGEDKKRLQQFDLLFARFFDNYQEMQTINAKKKMDNLSIYPLIGAGIITVMLIIGVVIIMEDMLYVL